jgi:uncharacterized DUF497 family protein
MLHKCSYILVTTDGLPWTWKAAKSKINKQRHGLSFESAQLVFDDPLAASRHDPHVGEERWQTIGVIGSSVIFVVHTWSDIDSDTGEETGRIISARKATRYEREAYEEGNF